LASIFFFAVAYTPRGPSCLGVILPSVLLTFSLPLLWAVLALMSVMREQIRSWALTGF
jgi:hypothetical protein